MNTINVVMDPIIFEIQKSICSYDQIILQLLHLLTEQNPFEKILSLREQWADAEPEE